MKDEIIELSKNLSIPMVGFTNIEYMRELESILIKQKELSYDTSFQVGSIDEKTFKNYSGPYKTIIAFGLPYQSSRGLNLKENEVYVSSSSWGEDYHAVLKSKLNVIIEFLKERGYKSESFVDNNVLCEKYLAYKAGLGFIGKNSLLINTEYGSNFFIGIILTDMVCEYDKKINASCGDCELCIKACPGNAIDGSGILNGKKCLSYITQKKELTSEEERLINKCIYGCDVCSNVCPYNMSVKKTDNFKMLGTEVINTKEYKSLSNKEFKRIYGKNGFSWRGKKIFERNININKCNK